MKNNTTQKNGGRKGMAGMMIPCLLLLGLLFLRGGSFSLGGFFWPILIGIAVVGCIGMMFRGHGRQEDSGTDSAVDTAVSEQLEVKTENHKHNHNGCCH